MAFEKKCLFTRFCFLQLIIKRFLIKKNDYFQDLKVYKNQKNICSYLANNKYF